MIIIETTSMKTLDKNCIRITSSGEFVYNDTEMCFLYKSIFVDIKGLSGNTYLRKYMVL